MRRCTVEPYVDVVGTARQRGTALPAVGSVVPIGDLGASTDWRQALTGVDVVIHTAGRVHQLANHPQVPLSDYRSVNVAGTVRLAQQA